MTAWNSSTFGRLGKPLTVLVMALLYYVVALGFRGLADEGFASLEAARQVAHVLSDDGALANLLASPHAGVDLVAGLLILALPAPLVIYGLGGLSLVCVLLAGLAVWKLARRSGGDVAAWAATAFFFTAAPVTAAATAVSTTALVLPFWTWLLYLATHRRQPWWSVAVQSLLGAVLFLSWAPVFVWFAIFLVVTLAYGSVDEDEDEAEEEAQEKPAPLPGLFATARVPVHVFLVPLVGILLATALHPGMWADIVGGWTASLGSVVEARPDPVLFRAEFYPPHRLPLLSGPLYLATQLSAVMVIAAVLGVFISTSKRIESFEGLGALLLWSLAWLALLPWIFRAPAYGIVEMTAMAAPLLAVFAGLGLYQALRVLLEVGKIRGLSPIANAVMVVCAAAVIIGAPAAEGIAQHPHHGSFHNVLIGHLPGAVARGYPMHAASGLDLVTLGRVLDEGCTGRPAPCRLYEGPWGPYLDAYVDMGAIEAERIAPRLDDAHLSLRRPIDFSPHRPETAQKAFETTTRGFSLRPLSLQGVPLYLFEIRLDDTP